VIAKDKFLVHWMPWRRSEAYAFGQDKVEVAVVFGMDPVTTLVGGVPVPPPLEKLFVSGVLRGRGGSRRGQNRWLEVPRQRGARD
jgi:3-polyprenyl-4-hydroxybenzoate decarboxylase and related decarboxylases